jgi:hypothetical protein
MLGRREQLGDDAFIAARLTPEQAFALALELCGLGE